MLSGENCVEETEGRLLCLNSLDLNELFQYHTYLDENAQNVFLPANQKALLAFSKNRKTSSDFAGAVQSKKESSKKDDLAPSCQGSVSIFWITMIGLLILEAASLVAFRRSIAELAQYETKNLTTLSRTS